jgi:hypothetical protein
VGREAGSDALRQRDVHDSCPAAAKNLYRRPFLVEEHVIGVSGKDRTHAFCVYALNRGSELLERQRWYGRAASVLCVAAAAKAVVRRRRMLATGSPPLRVTLLRLVCVML